MILEEVNHWQRSRTQLEVPKHLVDKQQHLSEREQKRTIGEWYVRTSPLASWEDLTRRLYNIEEDIAVDEAKEHLTNGMWCMCTYVWCASLEMTCVYGTISITVPDLHYKWSPGRSS